MRRQRLDFETDRNVGLTFVVAGGEHRFICWTGCNVPYLPRLVQKDVLIDDVILIIKVNDVNLKDKKNQRQSETHEDKAGLKTTVHIICILHICIIGSSFH